VSVADFTTERYRPPGAGPPRAAREGADAQRRPAGRAILLVDDDVTFVETLGALLRAAGYVVIAEYSQTGAMRYLTSHTPDALITDLRLGDGEGWTLAEFAREHQPSLPIVIVTGWSYVVPDGEGFERIPVFLKPFDPNLLLTYLDSLF
jgi:DNA-binding response OmpR family regulator